MNASRTRRTPAARALAAAIGLVTAMAAPLAASAHGNEAALSSQDRMALATARAYTAAFHDFELASQAGYSKEPVKDVQQLTCIADPGGRGAMGEHFVNGAHFGTQLDARRPQALIYEPQADGSKRLVGVEYLVFESDWQAAHPGTVPSLFGRRFHRVGEGNRYGLPPFYALHAWIWRHNPDGMFVDWNPQVRCP